MRGISAIWEELEEGLLGLFGWLYLVEEERRYKSRRDTQVVVAIQQQE